MITLYILGFAAALWFKVDLAIWGFCFLELYSSFFIFLYALAGRAVMTPWNFISNTVLRVSLLGIALTVDAGWVALSTLIASIFVLLLYFLSMSSKYSPESEQQ